MIYAFSKASVSVPVSNGKSWVGNKKIFFFLTQPLPNLVGYSLKHFIMITRKFTAILLVSFAMAAIGCIKDFETDDNNNFLRFQYQEVRMTTGPSSMVHLDLRSNIKWELSFKQPAPNWLKLNKATGRGNEIVVLTAIRGYSGNGRESATLVAKPLNSLQTPSTQVIIFRQDSAKGK